MPITVLCPTCHARFSVSEKFAGKQGPCPKCKTTITIPKLEDQVKVHETPSEPGTTDKLGRPLLKPVSRKDAKFNPIMAIAVGVVAVGAFAGAFVLRSGVLEAAKTAVANNTTYQQAITDARSKKAKEIEQDRFIATEKKAPFIPSFGGLIVLAPLLVWAAYQFLRDDEKGAYEGTSLWLRTAFCAAVYVALWGVFYLLFKFPFAQPEDRPETWMWLFLGLPFMGVGTVTAWGCLDFEWGDAFMHYCFFLIVTVLLRLAMGLSVA